jgi:hypothetical protein
VDGGNGRVVCGACEGLLGVLEDEGECFEGTFGWMIEELENSMV